MKIETLLTLGGLMVAVAGVGVPVLLFTAEWRRRRIADAIESRRRAIEQVLGAADRATRAYVQFPFSLLWMRPELEFSLALSRLLLDLSSKEDNVGRWVARQIQRMRDARSRKTGVAISLDIGFRLAAWHRGDIPINWFTAELEADPFEAGKPMPTSTRLSRYFEELVAWMKIEGGLLLSFVLTRRAARTIEESISGSTDDRGARRSVLTRTAARRAGRRSK
ncbi:MAG: hypothetical protein ABI435_03580 [Pseudolysinimonas sp.]